MSYTVKKISDIAGVTIRTLHHYDEIGLLKPAAVSPTGYRLYSEEDLARLQEILFFRELGFDLKEIKAITSRFGYNRRQALQLHKRLLEEKSKQITELIQAADLTLAAIEGGLATDKEGMFKAFDEATLEEYKKEARRRFYPTR